MILFVVILALLAAGVAAWASERLGKDAPRLVSILAFGAGLAWSAVLWLDGADANGLYAAMDWPWIARFGIHLALELDGS